MPRTLTAADRSALIRLASTMPAGSGARRSILSGLAKSSSSASIMREWRSKDSAEEQREVLGRALADTYEVLQTVAMLAKRTESADAQAVQNALRSVGSAMFDVSR